MKHTFEHKLYNLSTDYELLWKLINEGNRVPAWIVKHVYTIIIWDLVEVKMNPYKEYIIGTRGVTYDGFEDYNTFESFKNTCEFYSLHFIDNTKI